jgi:hypothetical protein
LAADGRRTGLFNAFAPDCFDLVIGDACHRGSARDGGAWREILASVAPAVPLGMTATPLRAENRDPDAYFRQSVDAYRRRQGIGDGCLAPSSVHRVTSDGDAAGRRPSRDDLDRDGRPIPDDYQTKYCERVVALRGRTETIARHLTDFPKKSDRFTSARTFCVDQEHASEVPWVLSDLHHDLVAQHPDDVSRVTADEAAIGRPSGARSGRGPALPRHPHHLPVTEQRRRHPDLRARRAGPRRWLDDRVPNRSSAVGPACAMMTARAGATSSTTPVPPPPRSPIPPSMATRSG